MCRTLILNFLALWEHLIISEAFTPGVKVKDKIATRDPFTGTENKSGGKLHGIGDDRYFLFGLVDFKTRGGTFSN